MPLRVATVNLGAGSWSGKRLILANLVEAGAQVINVQEGSRRVKQLREWCRRFGWTYCGGQGPGAAAVPQLVAPEVNVQRQVTHEAVKRTRVGEPGAGPAVAKRKVANRLRCHVDGELHHVINTHMTPSVQRTRLANWPRRVWHYRRHVARVAAVVAARERGTTTLAGDLNLDVGHRLFRTLLDPFRRLGLRLVLTSPTMSGRTIDQVWTNGRPSGVQVLRTPGDAHGGVVVTIAPRRRRR